MDLILPRVLIGMGIGTLVGMTGLGGGVLLLPILIYGLGVDPIIAVGSDVCFNVFTKISAGFLHWRQGTVDLRLVGALAIGSVPGAAVGVAILAYLRAVHGEGVNSILRPFLGVVLVFVSLLFLFQGAIERKLSCRKALPSASFRRIVAIGGVGGFLVGLSSVGSGTIIIFLLLLFVQCSPQVLVGSDILHAVVLTGFATLLHFRLGTVDTGLVLPLIIGSIPGSILGTRICNVLPGIWLKRTLCVLLLASGARLLV